MPEKIRTFVVDDTILYRKIASEVASSFEDVELAGAASNGELALKRMEQIPVDLVLCDVHMPVMDGVETLAAIKRRFPETFVVMMSGISSRSADVTIRALEMGAIDFIKKPEGNNPEENIAQLKSQLRKIINLIQIRRSTARILKRAPAPVRQIAAVPERAPLAASAPLPKSYSVLAIGVSTGGPEALNRLIPSLPATLPVPCVLVQHMPPKFTQSLAESLARKSHLAVVEAVEDQPVMPGTVYVAPGGHHMIVRGKDGRNIVGINDGPPENSCRPAVDVLFRSVAMVYGETGILSVVLTGMGSDGCNGVRAMKRKGCYVITQSEQSCVVYGMPRAVDEAGLSDVSLPLEKIPEEICKKLRC
jgi:two-component system chemotaxis response regulator CheB